MTVPSRPARSLVAALAVAAALLASGCAEDAAGAASPPTGGGAPVAAASAGLVTAPVSAPASLAEAPFDTPRQVLLPPGWGMSVWARVPGARLAVWAPDGALLVSRPDDGDVQRLAPAPGGAPPAATTMLSGLTQPHGLAFDGGTLYVAESNRVTAYNYSGGSATAPRTIVDGLPDAKSPDLRGRYAHALKSVAVGPDHAVYVSIGSTANVSPEDRTATPPRATIQRIPPGGGPMQTFASGVRNGTGLAASPDGRIWTAVNNRDNVAYPYAQPYAGDDGSSYGKVIPQYVNDHPAEALAALTPGRDLGWPYCNPDPDVNPGQPGTALRGGGLPFVRDVQTNADGSKLDCAALPPLEQSFGAHSAPLGLAFTTLPAPFGPGALVGVHGSWNRTAPRAPEVSFYPYAGGRLGDQRTLVGGFQAPDGSRWGRPVAAVTGPDGAVYVTDDQAGAVYRVAPLGR